MRSGILIPFLVALCALAHANQQDDSPSVIELPLRQHLVTKEALRARQAAKLAKLGRSARQLPKYDPRLLDGPFKSDYITSNIQFGTPAQNFTVAVSSGATRVFILGPNYTPANKGQNQYVPGDSSTYKDLGGASPTVDGTYTFSGEWFSDFMHFGKAKITDQGFYAITTIDEPSDFPFPVDGILGLNHLSQTFYDSSGEPTPPIDNLLKPLVRKMFTIWLDAASNGLGQGHVTIGAYDKSHCDGGIVELTTLTESTGSDYRYVAYFSGLNFGSDYYSSTYGNAYFDTSVSTIQLSSEDVKAIYDLVEPDYDWDTGLYTVDCDAIDDLKMLTIQFESTLYIYPESYAVDVNLGDNQCALALSTITDNYADELLVLGTPAFRERCIMFDLDNQRILTADQS